MPELLHTSNLTKRFGAVTAVRDISISVDEGEIRGVIGPNGSGKSTLFNCIAGSLRPSAGRIQFAGENVTTTMEGARARRGLVRCFQEPQVFAGLTVAANIRMALDARGRRVRTSVGDLPDGVDGILDLVGLLDKAGEIASVLPYGSLRRLTAGLAIAVRPRLLLLDEPAAGLTVEDRVDIARMFRRLNRAGITLMVIEHDMSFLMSLAQRISVLNAGSLICEGTPDEVQANAEVAAAYLGALAGGS